MHVMFFCLVENKLIYLDSDACIRSYQPGSTHITLNNRVIEPQEFSPFSLIETLSKETRTYGRLHLEIPIELIFDDLYHSSLQFVLHLTHILTYVRTDSMPLESHPTLLPAS
jgi:hypothetical protein